MGTEGWCCCLLSTPISLFGPLGGMVYFCFLSNSWRSEVIKVYNVEDEQPSCNCIPCCSLLYFGCHYPCVFFQLYNSLIEWQREGAVPSNHTNSNPLSNADKKTYRVNLPSQSIPGSFVQIILPDGRSTTVQVPPQVLVNQQGDIVIDVVA